ncbi:hypothetical protein BH11BAC2_BH11BAC2_10530 [soil metagenome]
MKLKRIYLSFVIVFLVGCSGSAVKEKINQAGDVTGQAVGEFASGVTSGMEKAFDVTVKPSANLIAKGISLGKSTVSSDSGATDNLLTVYVIFKSEFNGALTIKAYDSKGIEMGRVKNDVTGKKEEAQYIEFHFDKRTNIDFDSKLELE